MRNTLGVKEQSTVSIEPDVDTTTNKPATIPRPKRDSKKTASERIVEIATPTSPPLFVVPERGGESKDGQETTLRRRGKPSMQPSFYSNLKGIAITNGKNA